MTFPARAQGPVFLARQPHTPLTSLTIHFPMAAAVCRLADGRSVGIGQS
jgi:hypothetical protein